MAYKKSKFFTPRTAGFLNRVAREYIHAMGQKVLYYKVNAEKSDHTDEYERLFRESRKKYFDEPIELECSVYIDPKNTENFKDVAYELRTFINVFVERELLKKKNISPSIGDIVSFQDVFFRVFDTDDSKMYHGNPNYKYALELNCVDIRINNNENKIKSDVEHQKDKETFEVSLPNNSNAYFENITLTNDSNSYINSSYSNDFNTLNIDIKLKISHSDPNNTSNIVDVIERENENLFFFKDDQVFDIKKELADPIENNTFSITGGYFYLSMSYNVDSDSFHVVDRLYNFLKEEDETCEFNFFTY